jgi:hypothetical protein
MSNHSPALSRRSLFEITLAFGGASLLGARPAFARHETPAAGDWSGSILNRAVDVGDVISDEMQVIATFADLERQAIATGVQRPPRNPTEEEMSPWLNAIFALALPGDYGSLVLQPEARAYAGFGIEEVFQAADIGDSPRTISMYQGAFDRESVIAAWSEAGYSEIQSGDVAIWSIAEDDSFDFDNPVQKLFLARHNNAAFIGDDLIVFTSTRERIQEAIAAAVDDAVSLGENPAVAQMLDATPPLASGVIVPGSSIMVPLTGAMLDEDDPGAAASAIADQMAAPQMPPVRLALIGITGGGPYPSRETALGTGTPVPTPELARMEITLQTYSPEEARHAIDVAGERLETTASQRTGQPFNEIFASWERSVVEGEPIARISLELGESWPIIWTDLLYANDLGFIG